MKTNRFMEMFAARVWPALRPFVRRSRRCSRCIVSEKYAPLIHGVCQECLDYNPSAEHSPAEAPPAMRERFERTLRDIAREPRRYHVLLLLSGGKDSAYILRRLRQEHPELRILCLTVNTGFMSPAALDNARRVAEKLKTDLIESHAAIDRFADAYRAAFLKLKSSAKGAYGVVDYAEGSLIYEVGEETAQAMNIPTVVGGLTWVQLQKIAGVTDFEIVKDSGIRMIFPLAVWRTGEQAIRAEVRRMELVAPGADSPLVSNSSLIVAMSAADVLNLGYCSFEPEFAQLVREGKTDRKTWLRAFELLEFAARRGFLDKEMKTALSRLNLGLEHVLKGAS